MVGGQKCYNGQLTVDGEFQMLSFDSTLATKKEQLYEKVKYRNDKYR